MGKKTNDKKTRTYSKEAKWYAVSNVEFEAESKAELIQKYLDHPDPKPVIVVGREVTPKVTF